MNLGIIAASIATLRPLFTNLGGPTGRVSPDTIQGPYDSDQPFMAHSKAVRAGRKLTDILLKPMGITKTTDVEVTEKVRGGSEERV